jgi:hypothetical protein
MSNEKLDAERLFELAQQLRRGGLRDVRGNRRMKHGSMLIEMDQQLKLTGLESRRDELVG